MLNVVVLLVYKEKMSAELKYEPHVLERTLDQLQVLQVYSLHL
jgi:hypothetical protein